MKNAVTALLLTSTVLLGACKNDTETAAATDTLAATETTDTASATHPGSPGGTALVPDVVSGTTVTVVLNDGSIAVGEQAQAIPPGPAILTVDNRGTQVHNLYIEGEGISRAAGDTIAQGATATVDVNFKAGTYTLYCPIADHRTKGEEVTMTIGSASAPATTAPVS